MSSLWTPSGEHPVDDRSGPDSPTVDPAADTPAFDDDPLDPEGSALEVEELRRELASTPPEVVVANHCYGLFELAAVYLSQAPPLLPQAQLAIDALASLIDGLGDRLGEAAPTLREALAQVRLAFVQMTAAVQAATAVAGAGGAPPAEGGSVPADPAPPVEE